MSTTDTVSQPDMTSSTHRVAAHRRVVQYRPSFFVACGLAVLTCTRHVAARRRAASAAFALLTIACGSTAQAQTVRLWWDPPSGEVSSYVVEWGTAPGDHRASAVVGGDAMSFETPPLREGLRYYFVVRARDAQGTSSGPSNEVPVIVGPARTDVAARTTAEQAWPEGTLTMRVQGSGVIGGAPGAAPCADECRVGLPLGTRVVLSAGASPGQRFVRWRGDGCGTDTTCVIAITEAATVDAEFEPDDTADAREPRRRYLAEGAASDFFETRVVLANPTGRRADASLQFQRGDGGVVTHAATVAPLSTVHVDANAIDGLAGSSFSTVVTSDAPLVVDRTMTWAMPGGVRHGSHAESSVASPASRWYLAEGSTRGGFDLFYLLQNPGPSPVAVTIRYLRPAAPPLEKVYTLPPTSRTNLWVNQERFGPANQTALDETDVSAVIEAAPDAGIVVERAMYDSRPGTTFTAGHESAGLTAPGPRWLFAEGATGPFFDLFLLLANPGDEDVVVRVTYLLPDGTRVERRHRVGAWERYTIWVDREGEALADTAVSMVVESVNGAPIVAERSMWWPGDSQTWTEAHNSPGVREAGRAWAFADGDAYDGPLGSSTYLLVANPEPVATRVRVTLLFREGVPPVSRDFDVAATARFGIDVGEAFPEARGERFGALVESLGDHGAPIVVERAMYGDGIGQPWTTGSNLVATPIR